MEAKNTKVVILCGGLGTRLREETEFRPKPMVEIGGRPMLWHIMKVFAHYGYSEFVLCLGYRGEMVKEYFLNYEAMNNDFSIQLGQKNQIEYHGGHTEDGWRITLVDTGKTSLTGSRLKKVKKFINEGDMFMLTYGDGVADINLNELLKFHKSHNKIGTVTGVHTPSRFGMLVSSGESVIQFSEKSLVSDGYISGGFFVFNHNIFDYIPEGDNCTLEKEPLENLAKDDELSVYHHQGFWQCMDTYRDHEYLQELWKNNEAKWKIWE